jgi:hypothetical protein
MIPDSTRSTADEKLRLIKISHTLIWCFFNGVICYLLWAVITDHIDIWVWLGLACFLLEGIVLMAFRNVCPLTIIARKYSDSTRANFDIYLPEWLAKHNKTIYTSILVVILVVLVFRLLLS